MRWHGRWRRALGAFAAILPSRRRRAAELARAERLGALEQQVEELSAGLARLRAALDALPVGVVLADAQGTVVARNSLVGHGVGSWQGDVLVDEAVATLLGDAVAGRRGERVLDLFGPPRRVVSVRAVPVEGTSRGGLVVIDDVTERVRTDAVRTDFVANISHELKTPVGALTVLADAIEAAEDPADARRLAGKVAGEADRLSRTIDDLLELSRIELGGEQVREPVVVGEVLSEAVERFRPLATRHRIALRIDPPPPGAVVVGDRRQLVSAVGNLVENAVKYSEPGDDVELRVEDATGALELVVEDHGIGIPGRHLDRVFERFYRVDRARSRGTGGTGLGLSIVRHIANNHGGIVTVSSVEGEGSTFRLRIPLGGAEPPVDAEPPAGAGAVGER